MTNTSLPEGWGRPQKTEATPTDPYCTTRASEFLPKIKNTKSYFIGKLCTIICRDSSLVFKSEHQYYKHFLGFVEEFDDEGILIRHVMGDSKGYYFKKNILGIIEEVIKEPTEEAMTKIKDIAKQVKQIKPEAPEAISLDSIMKQASEIK